MYTIVSGNFKPDRMGDKYFVIIILLILQSCGHSFDKADLAILNVYNTGDTLVFQNGSDYDSLRITRKEVRYSGFSEGYAGNPQTCWTYYQMIPPGKKALIGFGATNGDQYSNEHLFLTGTKWKPDRPASIEIKYNGFGGPISNQLQNQGALETGYVEITHFCKSCIGIDSFDVVKIRWRSIEGIIWYQKKDSSEWSLVTRY